MSYSFTDSESISFTVTHARHIAAKVATDLKRLQRLYGRPSDSAIADYETEVVELLKAGYLEAVSYGFRRDGKLIEPTLRYTARELGGFAANDDDPGRIRPGADVNNASFYSYLTHSATWHKLSSADQDAFEKRLPFHRGGASEPAIDGYLSEDLTYSSGGRALYRASVRSIR
jgi:Bacterial HORMA domain family 1